MVPRQTISPSTPAGAGRLSPMVRTSTSAPRKGLPGRMRSSKGSCGSAMAMDPATSVMPKAVTTFVPGSLPSSSRSCVGGATVKTLRTRRKGSGSKSGWSTSPSVIGGNAVYRTVACSSAIIRRPTAASKACMLQYVPTDQSMANSGCEQALWNIGSGLNMTSPRRTSMRAAVSCPWRTIASWLSTQPLGSDVVPEV